MSHQVIELNCPGCNARVSIGQKECEWCHKPIIISTFNSVYSMPVLDVNKYAGAYSKALTEHPYNHELNNAAAMCYLELRLYDKAMPAFERALEDNFDNSETFFYAAVCLLRGKKAFLAQRTDINKAVEYLNAAIMIEPRGIYYYFLAYIKYDYFERKCLNTAPDYQECTKQAYTMGVSEFDKDILFGVLGVARPDF